MSKVYVASSCETMPDGSLAFGFHRCNLIDDFTMFGYWQCKDCNKVWLATAYQWTFDMMREDYECNP